MNIRRTLAPFAALALVFGSVSAAPADDDGGSPDRAVRRSARGDREDRPGREERADRSDRPDRVRDRQVERSRADASARSRARDDERPSYSGGASARSRGDSGNRDRDFNRYRDRGDSRNRYRDYDRYDRSGRYDRGRGRDLYFAPRFSIRPAPRRYYGNGGRFSIYFGIGSGYRYGAPYSGRVYGYRRYAYRVDQYYGDVRLRIQPRDAAVYVDGYYAGIVDDFDGFFQRLTLEVGPHQIEVEAPGLEPQVFDVYVDPDHTVDLRASLFR